MANVKLEYSSDGGTTYPNVIIATTSNTGSYAWTVPDAITTAARIKVSDFTSMLMPLIHLMLTSNHGSLTLTAPTALKGY